MKRERFLIVGCNSFSSSHCVEELLKRGFFVLGVSRSIQPKSLFLPYKWNNVSDVKSFNKGQFVFENIDLNKDLEKLINLIDKFNITHIINFAAQGMVAESWEKPLNWYQTNLMSQVAFHDELRKKKQLEKYLHFTTPEVYGDTNKKWISETNYFCPSTPYAVSRAACDLHLQSFKEAYDFPVIFTRAANVYGPGQQLYRIIPRTILSCFSGQKLFLHGNGLSERSFIHISDAIRATIEICLNGEIGSSFHISTQEALSIRDLVKIICELLAVNFEDITLYSEERLGKDQSYFLDSTKLRKTFNWKEEFTLEAGILSTIKWAKNNYDEIRNMSWEYEHKK